MKILIADDAPLLRKRMVDLIVGLHGVSSVLEAQDCASTLAMIRGESPDVVVLDLFMPDGSGLDVLGEIAEDRQRPDVIVLTALGSVELRERCLRAGAEGFFEKGSGIIGVIEMIEARTGAGGSGNDG